MNDQAEISAITKQRVLEAAQKLGYRPNRFASNMARQKDIAIGLAITSLRNPYYTDLVSDLDAEFATRGWQVIVVTSDNADPVTLVSRLAQQTDAVVGYFARTEEQELHDAARGLPLILFDTVAHTPGVDSVGPDFDEGMRMFVEGLKHRGARRFGMLDGCLATRAYSPTLRRQFFEKYAGKSPVAVGSDSMMGGANALEELLLHDRSIDTVIAFNDVMAIGAIQRAHELGISLPGDLRIAGIDGLPVGAALTPSLTTLAIDRPAIARQTAKWLDERLASPNDSSTHYALLPPIPVWRGSA